MLYFWLIHDAHDNLLGVLGVVSDRVYSLGVIVPVMRHSLDAILLKAANSMVTAKLVHTVEMHMMVQIASGLDHLHKHKVAHLSLHPRNVLLDAQLTVKLSDYARHPRSASAPN